MIPAKVKEYLQSHRQEQLDKLFELLAIPSIANHDDGSCERAAAWVGRYVRDLGFDTHVVAMAGGKPNIMANLQVDPSLPTVLFYGHYDVQPPDPLDEWVTGPFEPTIRNNNIYARGADDDKGQLFAHLMSLEAYRKTGTPLPVNVKLFIEGEEESGSPTLEPFIQAHLKELRTDAIVISDSEFFAPGVPSITYALRGVGNFEFTVREASTDAHSGVHGGALGNPLHAVAAIVAAMHDADGQVTIEGFYDGVPELSEAEREAWRKLPFDEAAYAASLGLKKLGGGEKGFSVLERRWARPTLEINGLIGGYSGPGSKTVIPAAATAKFSIRTVPGQDPQKISDAIGRFIQAHTPAGMTSEYTVISLNRPVMLAADSPAMRAAKAALKEAFGQEVAMIRCGASVPVTEIFQRLLGVDAIMLGLGLPDDNLHAPNEKFGLDQLYNGAMASAALLVNLREQKAR